MVLWIKTCYISDFDHHLTFLILSFSSYKKRKFYLINSEVLSSFDIPLFCGLWKGAQISLCYKTSLFGPFHIYTLSVYKLATWKSRFFLPHKTGIPSHSDECDLQVWFIDCEERAPASPHQMWAWTFSREAVWCLDLWLLSFSFSTRLPGRI